MNSEKNRFSNGKLNYIVAQDYLNKEKEYLECHYFQVLRNSNDEKFTEFNLYNFLSFSDYLHKRIFKIINKKANNNNTIKLLDFTNCISDLFSVFSSEKVEINKNELIFNLISDSKDTFDFFDLKEFLNNLIFEAFCKAKLTDFDKFIFSCKQVKTNIKKIFILHCNHFNNKYKISKVHFYTILKNNPFLKTFIKYLLNLISPINQKLIKKVCKHNYNFFINDEFENDWDLYNTQDKTPRVNDFSSYKEKEVLEFKKSKLFIEKSTSKNFKTLFKNNFSKDNNFSKKEETYIKEDLGHSTDSSSKYDLENSSREQYANLDKKQTENNIYSNKIINKSTIYNYDNFKILNNKTDKKQNPNNKSRFYEGIKEKENKTFVNLHLNENKNKIEDFLDDKNDRMEYDDLNWKNIKDEINFNLNYKNQDFEKNENSNNKDLDEILLYLHKKIKENHKLPKIHQKFKVFFIKEENFNSNDVLIKKTSDEECKSNELNNRNSILNNSHSLYIKFIESELILCNIRKTEDYSNIIENPDYFYIFKLKNIIFEPLPSKENCSINLNINIMKKFYYFYKFSNYDCMYRIFFEKYEDLITFYNFAKNFSKLFSNTSSFIYKNRNNNFHIIQNLINFDKCIKKFSYNLEISNQLSKTKLKIQLLNKKFLKNENNKLFLSSLFSLCRLNNFFNINIFPIDNIYENNSCFFIEYSSEEFMIEYDNHSEYFIVFITNLDLDFYFKKEISKFQKLAKILNVKEYVKEFFYLLNLQKSLIYS